MYFICFTSSTYFLYIYTIFERTASHCACKYASVFIAVAVGRSFAYCSARAQAAKRVLCCCTLLHYNSYVFYSLLPRIYFTLLLPFIACNFIAIVSAIFACNRTRQGSVSFILPYTFTSCGQLWRNLTEFIAYSQGQLANVWQGFTHFFFGWNVKVGQVLIILTLKLLHFYRNTNSEYIKLFINTDGVLSL